MRKEDLSYKSIMAQVLIWHFMPIAAALPLCRPR